MNRSIAISPDNRSIALIQAASVAVAFWPIWCWYCERLIDKSDEPLGLVALITAVGLSILRQSSQRGSAKSAGSEATGTHLLLLVSLILIYCAASPWTTPLPLALLAVLAVGLCMHRLGAFCQPTAGDWALLFLSLPIVASLNFYIGYPLRVLTCNMAAALLNLGGLAVTAQGAQIVCNTSVVGIDAPCSGIRMLWMALFMTATMTSLRKLSVGSTIKFLLLAVVTAVIANTLRVSSLFYTESGIFVVPDSLHIEVHAGVGLCAFGMASGFLMFVILKEQPAANTFGWIARMFKKPTAIRRQISPRATKFSLIGLIIICIAAALVPLFHHHESIATQNDRFPGWPSRYEGRALTAIPLSKANEEFARGFPGRIAVFKADGQRIVFRYVDQATRQLHPSCDCYRASGYEIKWLPQTTDSSNNKWTVFEASKPGEKLLVRERLYDNDGHAWTDVSSWYWSAVLKKSSGPWWSITVTERI